MDGWVTVWWRRRSKREITLLSPLCFSRASLPPLLTALSSLVRSCAPRDSSSNYLKRDILFSFGPLSSSVCPAGKFYLSDQTGSRSTRHSNHQYSLSFFLNAWSHDSATREKKVIAKKNTYKEGRRVNEFTPRSGSGQRDVVHKENRSWSTGCVQYHICLDHSAINSLTQSDFMC